MFLAPLLLAPVLIATPPRNALRYRNDLIREARFAWGLSAPVATMGAQIHQESAWNETARSAYASGLAQFTPQTADWISGVYANLGPSAPLNPSWAIRALVTYDKRLFDSVRVFNSACDRFQFALSDYNGGAGRRIARQRLSLKPGSYAVTGKINPGISASNQRENESYAPRIVYRLQPVYASWGPGAGCEGVQP